MAEIYLLIRVLYDVAPPLDIILDVPEGPPPTFPHDLAEPVRYGSGLVSTDYVPNQIWHLFKNKIDDLSKIIEKKHCRLEFEFWVDGQHTDSDLQIYPADRRDRIKRDTEAKIRKMVNQAINLAHLRNNNRDMMKEVKILSEENDLNEINIGEVHQSGEDDKMNTEQTRNEDNIQASGEFSIDANLTGQMDQEITLTDSPVITPVQEQGEEVKRSFSRKSLPKIIVRREALDCAKKHAWEERDMETGGVLVGQFVSADETVSVVVTGIVRGLHTIRRIASLTFTPETWAQMYFWIDNDPIYSDDKTWSIVGWYHTHPSFGIFLSSADLKIHKPHFKRPEHIALVIDPSPGKGKEKEGFFCWDLTQTEVMSHVYEIVEDDGIRENLKLKDLPVSEISAPSFNIKRNNGDE